MSKKKNSLKGFSEKEKNFLLSLAKIYVKFIVKQAEEQNLRNLKQKE